MNTTNSSIFELVPRELWRLIVTFLDSRSKRVHRLANKEWFNIINCDNFTIFFANDNNLSSIAEHFSKYSNPISISFKKSKFLTLTAEQLVSSISVLKNVKSLKFKDRLTDEDLTDEDWSKLTHLTGIQEWELLRWQSIPSTLLSRFINARKIIASVSAKDLALGLKSLTNLENLGVSTTGAFCIDPFIELPNPSNLTKLFLRIDAAKQSSASSDAIEKFKQFSNLKVLTYECFSREATCIHIDRLTSLESLSINAADSQAFHTNTNLTHLDLCTDNIQLNHFQEISQLKKLRVFEFQWPNNITYRQFEVLTALTDLQKLALADATAYFVRDKREDVLLANWIPTSVKSLMGRFKVRDLIRLEQLEELVLSVATEDLEYLTALTKLTELRAQYNDNISAVNLLTYLKKLHLNGRLTPVDDFDQLNLEQLTNLETLWMVSQEARPNLVNGLSKLTKLSKLGLSFSSDHYNGFNFNFDNLKLTSFTNCGSNNSNELIQCLAKITTLNKLSFDDWKSEENVVLFTALENLTYLALLTEEENVFLGKYVSVLTNLQQIRKVGYPEHEVEELMKKMPYLTWCS